MAGEFDEMSRAFGGLESKIDTLSNHARTLFGKMDGVNVAVIEAQGAIKLLGTQVTELRRDLADVENVCMATAKTAEAKATAITTRFDAAENRGRGAMWVLGVLGISVSGAVAWFISTFTHAPSAPPPG